MCGTRLIYTRPVSYGGDFTQRDIEFHRQTAARYDDDVTRAYSVYHRYLLEPYLDRLQAELPAPRRALDLGCGTGVVSLALARRGFDVTGIDHSEDMLSIARQKASRSGAGERCRFLRGDVRALPFADSEFDCVTCQGLLHHLDAVEACLRELVRVLRPGGAFYISEPTSDETPVKRALMRLWRLTRRGKAHPAPASEGPETVEAPIDVGQLETTLRALDLDYRMTFLTHIPPARRVLPDGPYLALVRAISFPWRSRQGDLVFVFGKTKALVEI